MSALVVGREEGGGAWGDGQRHPARFSVAAGGGGLTPGMRWGDPRDAAPHPAGPGTRDAPPQRAVQTQASAVPRLRNPEPASLSNHTFILSAHPSVYFVCSSTYSMYPFTLLILESPLDCEEIQPVHPKGDQS